MLYGAQPRNYPVLAFFGLSAVMILASLVLAFFPVGRTVGNEYVLVLTCLTALFGPAAAVLAGAHLIGRDANVLLEAVVSVLLPLALPPLITSVLFLLLPTCDARSSWALYLLGPPATAVLCIALVAIIGKILTSALAIGVLAYLTVFVSLGLTVWRLYREPVSFMFLDHFFGAYCGTFYDEIGGLSSPLVHFRVLTWLWALTGLLVVRALVPRTGNAVRRAPAWAALFLVLGLVLRWSWGAELFPDRDDIRQFLGRRVISQHFEIYVDRALDDVSLKQLVQDHEFRYSQIKDRLGVVPTDRVLSFVYPDADTKRRFTGAAATQFARPWQLEIHLNGARFPHPTLPHELVHVLAAPMGTGPFKVSATGFGLLVRSGLVEGLARALEPDLDEVPLLDRVRALKQLGLLPGIDELVKPVGFWFAQPTRAYDSAGSLLQFLLETHGMGRVRAFYQSGDFSALAGASAEETERAWHALLDKEPPTAKALALMRRRYERGGVFNRRCVRARSTTLEQVADAVARRRFDEAREALQRLHDEEPEDLDTARWMLHLGREAQSRDDIKLARSWLEASGSLTAAEEAELSVASGDLAWQQADIQEACASFAAPTLAPQSSAQRRALRIRDLLCDWHPVQDPAIRGAVEGIFTYLGGSGPELAGGPTDLVALQRLRPPLERTAHPAGQTLEGIIAYLIGRGALEFDPTLARQALDEALGLPHPDREIWNTALVLRGSARFLTGDLERAAQDLEAVLAEVPGSPQGRSARDLLQRIAFTQGTDVGYDIERVEE